MFKPTECAECRAIIEELQSAAAQMSESPKLKDAFRADCVAMFPLTPERIEDLIEKFPFRPRQGGDTEEPKHRYPKFRDALLRMAQHRLRTGHKIW